MAQTPEAAFKQAMRMVRREVDLREAGRRLELTGQQTEADWLFRFASLVREERLSLLVRAGVLEP